MVGLKSPKPHLKVLLSSKHFRNQESMCWCPPPRGTQDTCPIMPHPRYTFAILSPYFLYPLATKSCLCWLSLLLHMTGRLKPTTIFQEESIYKQSRLFLPSLDTSDKVILMWSRRHPSWPKQVIWKKHLTWCHRKCNLYDLKRNHLYHKYKTEDSELYALLKNTIQRVQT